MVSRRGFLIGAAATFGVLLSARAQQSGKSYRVGVLDVGPQPNSSPLSTLREGLRERGYVEGKNITFDYRWGESRLPELAAELVRLSPDVIVTPGTQQTIAVKQATSTIPVVMSAGANPVDTGIVANLARPGGNITGVTWVGAEVAGKRVELLKSVVPSLTRVAVLVSEESPATRSLLRNMEESAERLGVRLLLIDARSADRLDGALIMAKTQGAGLVVNDFEPFMSNAKRIAQIAIRSRIPSIGFRLYGEIGGLLAYGPDFRQLWLDTAVLIDKIFKGSKPADLPIQQATRFELIINLKTAKALGLAIPDGVRLRADQLIE